MPPEPDRGGTAVIAVIVAYQSNLDTLAQIAALLRPQCAIIVVDNSPDAAHAGTISAWAATAEVDYVAMGGNSGIGAAQNRGIARAWARGADAVLLLDDDSLPPPNLVERLLDGAAAAGPDAVVGANAVDADGREISNVRGVPGALPRCRDLMSSGTLIRRAIFERVGPFDEGLFIDGVDFEWGWRARRLGVSLYVCRATAIIHRLGQGRAAGAGIPSPIRHYFQYRNMIRLIGARVTPWRWRVEQMVKLPLKLVLILLFMPRAGVRLRHAAAGIRDGLRGRGGPAPGTRGASA